VKGCGRRGCGGGDGVAMVGELFVGWLGLWCWMLEEVF
jgi:hypothetical protein